MHSRFGRERVISGVWLVTLTVALFASGPGEPARAATPGPGYLNLGRSFSERAADLVSRMTLDEKAAQLSTTNAPAIERLGIQSYSYWNESQHGVYFLQGDDNETGQPRWFHQAKAPSFPTNLSTSLTWDRRLIHREASAIGDEVRGFNAPSRFGSEDNNLGDSPGNYGSLFHFNPTVNLQRDPRWGRTDEAFGEDPFLVANLAGAYVRGFQGAKLRGNPRTKYLKAVSTLKHYALNNVETGRTATSSNTDEATIRDYYTAQFRRLIERSGATGLMSAYNSVNGTPAVADSFLLNDLARRSWGFDGYVTSDCGAVATTYRLPGEIFGFGGPVELSGHDWAPFGWTTDHGGASSTWTRTADGTEVSGPAGGQAFSLRAGTALNCAGAGPGNQLFRSWFGQENEAGLIEEAVHAGILGEGVIDRALMRVFTLRMRTGEFDPRSRVGFARIGGGVVDSTGHRRLTGEVARRSLVLLKNAPVGAGKRKVLPADPASVQKVVVLGDLAGRVVLGGYSGTPTEEVSVREGVEAYLARTSPRAEVIFDDLGTSTTATGPAVISDGIRTAIHEADLVLMMAGTDENSNAEGSDRASLSMPGNYESMIEQVSRIGNPNLALYIQSAGPVSLGGAGERVPAVLFSGPNGQRQGSALASVLFGASEPRGRLSFTWYRNDSQLPPIGDYDLTPEKTGGLGRTYRYFTGKPRFPFGYGLSYTKFRYSKARLPRHARARGRIKAGITVTNAGRRAGSTVLQVYAVLKGRRAGRQLPRRRLVGFARTGTLRPGRSQRLKWRIPAERLRLFDRRSGRDVVYRGRYRLLIGTSAMKTVADRATRVTGRLPQKIRHVTVEPPRLDLRQGQKLNLQGRNRWLGGLSENSRPVSARIVTAVREDQSFVDLRRRKVRYSSNRPRVVRVRRNGRLTAIRPGVATVTVSVGGARGRATFVVR